MRDIELEEGEAYFLQHDDDDENIDPDKDFSYLDKKIENVLGHYQKDFLGGVSAESLGARYGGYGSFLPMQQRSPPVLSNQRTQSHISSKSPQNLPSERTHQNPIATANHSVPAKPGPQSGDIGTEVQSDSGISLMNKEPKLHGASECLSDNKLKILKANNSEQNLLRFRVKMTTRDNSAIYSGLGLDISPSSSLEDSPSDYEGTSPGIQEMKLESPSYIIKIMTAFPLSDDELLSPLHDSLVGLMVKENNLETVVPDSAQVSLVNSCSGNAYSEGKREANSDRRSKVKDPSKDRKSKQKEPNEERKSKKKVSSAKPSKLVKENQENLNAVTKSGNRSEGSGTTGAQAIVVSNFAISGADARSLETGYGLTGQSTDSKSLVVMSDKKSEVGCSNEDFGNTMQRVSAPASPSDALLEDVKPLIGKTDIGKNATSSMRRHSITDKRKEVAHIEDEAKKFEKQHNVSKDKVKEGLHDSARPKQYSGRRKEIGMVEKIPKDKEVGSVSMKGVGDNFECDDINEQMKDYSVETHEPPKQKTLLKAMPYPEMEAEAPDGKGNLSFKAKKKSRGSQSDGIGTAEPSRGTLVVGSSTANDEVVTKHSIPSNSRRGEKDLLQETRKDNYAVGVSETETPALTSTPKEKHSKTDGFASNIGLNVQGDRAGDDCAMEKLPVADMPPADNVLQVNWVQCDKCEKWRILPLGVDPKSLPNKWRCSMQHWWPGKNKCSVDEHETNDPLSAVYQPVAPTSQVQSNLAYADGSSAIGGIQHGGATRQANSFDGIASGDKRKNLAKTEIDAPRRSSSQDRIPVKKDQHHSSELMSSRNQKKPPRELNVARKSGDSKSSKIEKKRAGDFETSGVSKKIKRTHQQSMGTLDVGPSTVEDKGAIHSLDPGALRSSQDFGRGRSKSPLMKVKDRTQKTMIAEDNELKDISAKKRKLKDRQENITSTGEHSGRMHRPPKNWDGGKKSDIEQREVRKESKSRASKFQVTECPTDKGNGRTYSDGGKHSVGNAGDNSRHKKGRKDAGFSKASEKALDLGLSDNATTSSSSKMSYKLKAKASEVKCSPIGSISSSPIGVSKSDPDKGTNKIPISHNEFTPHSEDLRDRKSNLSRSSAAGEDHSARKSSAGRHPGAHREITQTAQEDRKDARRKLDPMFEDIGASTSQDNLASGNLVAKLSNRLPFVKTSSDRGRSHDPHVGSEKESSGHPQGLPESDKGNGSMGVGTTVGTRVSLRHPDPSAHLREDIEASSSVKKDSSHRAAKSALREATNLKHSANRMKKTGSTLESTEIFFQAALKFLHGASLLEAGDTENGGEMTSTYSSTGELCEYCAQQYERHHNLASAALAYKCMEVAYMRVVYCNDIAASRDRTELQMAVRAAPQVESPSSSASDIDNLNNQAAIDTVKHGNSVVDHQVHVISAGNRPNFERLLNFTGDINRAMEASRRSQSAFAAATAVLAQSGEEGGISVIKRVLDFSFHDVDGLVHLVRLAMEALKPPEQ